MRKLKNVVVTAVALMLLLGTVSMAAGGTIQTNINGIPWYDTANNTIDAHGMSFIEADGYYYMFGTERENDTGAYDNIFRSIKCYRSTDLVDWEYRGEVLDTTDLPDGSAGGTGSRPSVIYNESTGKYVMYMKRKVNGTKYAAIATSNTVDGHYTFESYLTPWGGECADMSLFKNDDGKAYLVYAESINRGGHSGRSICVDELSSDYLSSVDGWRIAEGREAPVMFKSNGTYYVLSSGVTGWNANQMKYVSSSDIKTGWSGFSKVGNSTTFESQPCDVLPIHGSTTTTNIYIGDRHDSNYLGDSTYVWLPIEFSGSSLVMDYHNSFEIDLTTGQWRENEVSVNIDNVSSISSGRMFRNTSGNVTAAGNTRTGNKVSWNIVSTEHDHDFYIDNVDGAGNGRLHRDPNTENVDTDVTTKTGNNVLFRVYAAGNGQYYIDCIGGGRLSRDGSGNVQLVSDTVVDDTVKWTIQ